MISVHFWLVLLSKDDFFRENCAIGLKCQHAFSSVQQNFSNVMAFYSHLFKTGACCKLISFLIEQIKTFIQLI